jgi:hypothetical protein
MKRTRTAAAAGVAAAAISALPATASAAFTEGCTLSGNQATCTYLEGTSPFVVPPGVNALSATAVGGTGGGNIVQSGGPGVVVTGTIHVVPGETLYAAVGGNGHDNGAGGGANGGGAGGGGGGGGESDLRLTASDPASAQILAGGGGGTGLDASPDGVLLGGSGGAAGYQGLADEVGNAGGQPGNLTSGGRGGVGQLSGQAGTAGHGGAGGNASGTVGGGGGGGGLYGGGGGAAGPITNSTFIGGGGGGGGSSLVPPGGTIDLDFTATPRVVITYTDRSQDETPLADFVPLGSLTGGSPYTLSFNGSGSHDRVYSSLSFWQVKWGDGSASTLGSATVPANLPHTYAHPGTYLTTLTVSNTDETGSADASVVVTVSKAASALTGSPGTEQVSGTTMRIALSATLKRTDTGGPLAGKTVFFGAANTLVCVATTTATGLASCTGSLPAADLTAVLGNGYTATFSGDGDTLGSSTSGKITAGTVTTSAPATRQLRVAGLRSRMTVVRSLHGSSGADTQRVLVGLSRGGWLPSRLLTAYGTRHWSVALRHRLKPGRYHLAVIAFDGRGRAHLRTLSFRVLR